MTSEDGLRELAGFGGPAQLTFMGETFPVRSDALVPLLRFAGSGPGEDTVTEEQVQNIALAAMYRLLEDCVQDFPRFENTAFTAKAGLDDIIAAVQHLVEFYCARTHWPARRLLGFIASNLDEFDGKALMHTGRGIAGLSAREACNLALAMCLDGRDEESRTTFLEDLNFQGNPEAEAQAMVRAMIKARAEASAAAAEAAPDDGRDRLGPEGA
jgi:hypothetical protein